MFDYPEFPLTDMEQTCISLEACFRDAAGKLQLGTEEELRVLYELAAGFHDDLDDGYIVEFGSFMGVTAAAMAHAAEYNSKQLPVIAVDNYIWNPTALPVAHNMFRRIGQGNNIVQIIFDDLNAFKFLCKMSASDFPIRLLFIDADHSYKHVMETLEICVPHVLPRGWIALHDYNRHGGGPDITEVVQAAQDFLRTAHDEFEFIFLTHGLLCLRKR